MSRTAKMGSRRKRLEWGLALVAVLVALILGELMLRLVWKNPHENALPDKVLTIRIQHPFTRMPIKRSVLPGDLPPTTISVDSRGYVLPSFQYEDPDFTVAFLGGSTTQLSAVSEDQRFHALVSTQLEDEFSVNTLNSARSGNTSHDALNILLNHVVDDRPDIVLMMHVANDVGFLSKWGGYRWRKGRYVTYSMIGKWVAQIMSRRLYIVGLIRELIRGKVIIRPGRQSAEKTTRDLPVQKFKDRLEAFVGLCRAFDAVPILVTQPSSPAYRTSMTPSWVDASYQVVFNDIIREVGLEQRVIVLDLVQYLKDNVPDWEKPDVVFYDALHVNDRGSRHYADHISDRLREIMRDLQAGQQKS